ncbi:tyrosine-type recombinase/integrase [Sphingomonas hengshuiensis]|uniref:Integrase n=1 Tax=Sphingomonas hengshuiensis TaxID=1609977 RepID=A0A7U4LFV6_9SPHN|nr:integrase arm-type DNA-binding domain-containing protein [Sphingomonas hengshuiensis]AJP72912.1 integrase [Sphingomonas hengshuiensis]
MLTNAAVKAAGARSRAYKIFDERGLHLFVAPNGRKSWRMKFRLDGREQLLSFGTWPELSLAEARTRCDAARMRLDRGEDPRAGASAPVAAPATFESVARDWHALRAPRWSTVHAADVLASLERDLFPAIGATPIGAIDAQQLLELIQRVEARGAIETARRLRQRAAGIFAYARRKKMVAENPAADLADDLALRPPPRRQPALLELEQLHALIAACSGARAGPLIKTAHLFLALTAVRLEALRGARWEEIEDIDGDAPVWRVPAARMKLTRAKKGEAAFDHLVPLVPAAITLLRAAAGFPGAGQGMPCQGLIFTGRSGQLPIGESAIGDLIDRAGFSGQHVPHGWRASFSTILNEHFPVERDVIDQALGHAPRNKVEAAYNRAQQLQRRRWIFERWAELVIAA